MDGLKQELREEIPDDLPLDIQEDLVDSMTGESDLPIDTGLEVVVRKADRAVFAESHVHGAPDEMVFHLTPEDARSFESEVLDPVIIGMLLDGELDFDNDYDPEDCT